MNVLDPDFAPLLAARLAAEVVAADWLYPEQKSSLIQPLTVIAIHDRTTLDTILARLLVVSAPLDLPSLEQLLPLAQQVYAQYPDSP